MTAAPRLDSSAISGGTRHFYEEALDAGDGGAPHAHTDTRAVRTGCERPVGEGSSGVTVGRADPWTPRPRRGRDRRWLHHLRRLRIAGSVLSVPSRRKPDRHRDRKRGAAEQLPPP